MFGKSKKTVSLAYKEELQAKIAYYDKRIEDALNNLNKQKRTPIFIEDESFENVTNPYKFKIEPSHYELKQQEASLRERASMGLELAMLTIMQSEVNIMVAPPELSKPVLEDGLWHEVTAECKIDLVSFTITFFAHKPYRRYAPTRYRNVAVALVKPAHQKELAQSILPKLQLPNLAYQVLQSYAAAYRSRRTTMRELAEKYAEKLKMQPMPEGGYRVRFLDLLQVDWTLENLWSPIVPFCHRMKFELEYMPKDYIRGIGKLYKQFKDPTLDTDERTAILSEIFNICLEAAGPAREMQESFESDPETAGRAHERRTTIDQEPDVPNVEQSPKKPTGKENKPQSSKTDMAPPKTIPKKAKKSKLSDNNTTEGRKSVKRPNDSDGRTDAKKSRNDVDDRKSRGGLKGGSVIQDKGETGADGLQERSAGKDSDSNNEENVSEVKAHKRTAKNSIQSAKDTVKATASDREAKDGKTVKSKTTSNTEVDATKNAYKKKGEDIPKESKASSKDTKKVEEKSSDKNLKSKDMNVEHKAAKSKKGAENVQNDIINKNSANRKQNNIMEKKAASSKSDAENITDTQNRPNAKNTGKSKNKNNGKIVSSKYTDITKPKKDTKKGSSKNDDVEYSKLATKTTEDAENVTTKSKKPVSHASTSKTGTTYTKGNTEENPAVEKIVASSKSAASKDGKDKVAPKVLKAIDVDRVSKVTKASEKGTNVGGAVLKKPKENSAKTEASKTEANKNNINTGVAKENTDKNTKRHGKDDEKSKVVKEKQTETAKIASKDINNEKALVTEKRKMNAKSSEQKSDQGDTITVHKMLQKTDKNNEVAAKKIKTTEPYAKNVKNKDDQPKKIANSEKPKIDRKPTNTISVLKEKTNKDETLQKAVEKSKFQNTKTTNMLNVTITKPKIIPISKLPSEKQIKIADKLKTKIPMMKSKTTFSSLSNKLGVKKVGTISKGVERTKIPQKSLPVFKNVAKNVPTRISPRKLPTFKLSSKGFWNK